MGCKVIDYLLCAVICGQLRFKFDLLTKNAVDLLTDIRQNVVSEYFFLGTYLVHNIFVTEFDLHIFRKYVSDGMLNKPSETFKMLIPAALYAMQNNLLHVALSHLDAATFQVSLDPKFVTMEIMKLPDALSFYCKCSTFNRRQLLLTLI